MNFFISVALSLIHVLRMPIPFILPGIKSVQFQNAFIFPHLIPEVGIILFWQSAGMRRVTRLEVSRKVMELWLEPSFSIISTVLMMLLGGGRLPVWLPKTVQCGLGNTSTRGSISTRGDS